MPLRTSGQVTLDWVRALETRRRLQSSPGNTLAAVVAQIADFSGDSPALIGTDETLSYAALARRIAQYAGWAAQEMPAGTVVALLMQNQPDYIAIWLGLTQAGCVVALLNTNLATNALGHCITTAAATHVIVAASLAERAGETAAQLGPNLRWWSHGGGPWPRMDLAAFSLAGSAGPHRPAPSGQALLIYTSGTTGLPKATHVSHGRVLDWSGWFAGMMDATAVDRLYDCLPLYHSTGGVVAVGAMLVAGGSVVLRERFSASRFWADVDETGCTIFQYIGELCRYLLQSAPQPAETRHRLRLCCGNGLSGAIWPDFQERFHIPRILEFYAATEGSLSLYNCEGKPGAVGRIPAFLAHRFALALIQYDADSGEPLRDAAGRCIRSGENEPGEAIALLGERGGRRFEGYTDPDASARKLLHDVFEAGDRWFRSGDLMRQDAAGFYYFTDRLGETYRWKGENVATTEVASVVLTCPGVTDAAVYGVSVPGAEGKAGMAAIVVEQRFELPVLHAHLQAHLPGYARPLFIRRCASLDTTGTFKLNKTALAREGYAASSDPVWVDDKAAGAYVRFEGKALSL